MHDGGAAGGSSGGASENSAAPKIVSAAEMRLPIEQYMFTNSQRGRIVEAKEKVIELCVQRFGLTYEPSEQSRSFQPETLTALRYGITSESDAAGYGYRPAGSEGSTAPVKPKPVTKEVKMLLKGTTVAGEYRGRTVPEGGCIGESRRALQDTEKDGGGGDAEVSNKINANSWQLSYQDKRVRVVFNKWAHCMQRAGHHYADPMEANNDPRWRKTASATSDEKKVAVADARCKKAYNVVGTWYASDRAYQERMIKEHSAELKSVREKIKRQTRLATSIVDD
jgi:hypothetical protein